MTDDELAELLRTVIARPDDHEVLAIYADVLIERGDPRGELINLQLQPRTPEVIAREGELTAQLDTWLAKGLGHPRTAFAWRRGFVEAIDFTPDTQRRSLVEAVRMLGTLPTMRQLRRIVFRFVTPGWGAMGPVISALARVAPQLRSLRELVFTSSGRDDDLRQPDAVNLGDLEPVLRAIPRLEVLELPSPVATLRDIRAPALKRLVIEHPSGGELGFLAQGYRLENLEELELLGGTWFTGSLPLEHPTPLHHLALETRDVNVLRDTCRDVPPSLLFRGVRTFTLGGAALDKTCVDRLLEHAAHLRRLRRFEVETGKHVQRLQEALGDIVVVR